MSTFQMAQLTPDQSLLMARLHARCFSEGWTAQVFEEMLNDPRVVGLAAISDVGPCNIFGFVLLRIVVDEAEILTLGVEPKERRRSLGLTLVEAGLVRAFSLGAKEVFLEVSARNSPAQALYKSLGFEEVAQRKNYYQIGAQGREDALVYRLRHGGRSS
jgi:[ribosomal protein S18]-alanine N-acetyltransferase